ncbi:location of vulva defective 1-like [Haliotis cracherodii]|uniref:location of vulva defective 1-like n=1 Tax=Haliotis cracherodii TaxID=6455 RepID=UPI0039EC597C
MHIKVCINVVLLQAVLMTDTAKKCNTCKKGRGGKNCVSCSSGDGPQNSTVSILPSETTVPTLAVTRPTAQTSFSTHDGSALLSSTHAPTRTPAALVSAATSTPTLPYGIPTTSPSSTSTYTVSQRSSEIPLQTSFPRSVGSSEIATHFNDVTSVNTYSSDVYHNLPGCQVLSCTFKPHSGPVSWTMLDGERYDMRAQCAEWCGRKEDCAYFVYVADSKMCNVYASDGTQSSESEAIIWVKVSS